MFTSLPTFSVASGLSTWSTSSTGTPPLVGINPTGQPITALNASAQPGQVFFEPGSGSQAVVVGWTSPFTQAMSVSINASVSPAPGPEPCTSSTWTLEKNATVLHTHRVPDQYAAPAIVPPGASIYVAVSNAGGGTCPATGLSLQITANATAPPVTVTSPAAGSSSTVSTPTFSGTAGSEFGDAGPVTLRVYSGTVLVVTRRRFQAVAGGPLGRLVVVFAYVHIPGGTTRTIIRTVLAPVAAVLRRHASIAVTISANLRSLTGKAIHASARHQLRRTNT